MIVALTAYRRPRYLKEVLGSLWVASLRINEPVYIAASVEPSPHQDEIVALLEGAWVTRNASLLSCCWNTRQALDGAWKLAGCHGEDYVLMLEDDYVLAPDALEMHIWMREKYRDDLSVIATGSFFRERPDSEADHNRVVRTTSFVPQVWGTWRDRWTEIRPLWHDRKPEDRGPVSTPNKGYYLGWDVNFQTYIMGTRVQVRPALSRVVHIGVEDGQHTTSSIYPKTLPLAFAGECGIPGVSEVIVKEGLWPSA